MTPEEPDSAKNLTPVKVSPVRRFVLVVEILFGTVVLTCVATLSTSFAVRDGQPSEHWIFTAMTVVAVLALGSAAVFSENVWIRRLSVAALGVIGALGAIANYLLLEPPGDVDAPLPDVVRLLFFGTIGLAGAAIAQLVSLVYNATDESAHRSSHTDSEVVSAR